MIGGIGAIDLFHGDAAGVAALELFVAVEIALEVIAIVLRGPQFGLGGGNLLGAAAVFQLGVIGFGLVHHGQGRCYFIGPRARRQFRQGSLGGLHVGASLGDLGLQIGRFQLGHRLALVDRVTFIDIALMTRPGILKLTPTSTASILPDRCSDSSPPLRK